MGPSSKPERASAATLPVADRRRVLLSLAATAAAAVRPAAAQPVRRLHFLVPAAVGGGWDQTARSVAAALTSERLVDSVTFEHISGDGGGRAIGHLVATGQRQHDTLMVASTPVVLRAVRGVHRTTYRDLTPIAAVIGDYAVIVVRGDSPYRDFKALAAAIRREPRRLRVAGGSVRGGMDHVIAARAFADGGAMDPKSLVYLPYDAGGAALNALLGGHIEVLATGLGELLEAQRQQGVRILAVTAAERVPQAPNVPTLRELGQDVTFVNWRGFFGPPQVPPATADAHAALLARLHALPAWADVRAQHAWQPLLYTRAEFAAFLADEEAIARRVLGSLGIA